MPQTILRTCNGCGCTWFWPITQAGLEVPESGLGLHPIGWGEQQCGPVMTVVRDADGADAGLAGVTLANGFLLGQKRAPHQLQAREYATLVRLIGAQGALVPATSIARTRAAAQINVYGVRQALPRTLAVLSAASGYLATDISAARVVTVDGVCVNPEIGVSWSGERLYPLSDHEFVLWCAVLAHGGPVVPKKTWDRLGGTRADAERCHRLGRRLTADVYIGHTDGRPYARLSEGTWRRGALIVDRRYAKWRGRDITLRPVSRAVLPALLLGNGDSRVPDWLLESVLLANQLPCDVDAALAAVEEDLGAGVLQHPLWQSLR